MPPPGPPDPQPVDDLLETAAAVRSQFLSALFSRCNGEPIEFRALSKNESPRTAFFDRQDADRITTFIAETIFTCGIFVGVATRTDRSSGKLENCQQLPALFVDFDFKDMPEREVRRRLAEFPIPPSLVTRTGGGLHVSWLLDVPITLSEQASDAKVLLRRLARALGGDLNAAEPARVLRVPGTVNYKYDPPWIVELETCEPDRRYPLRELEAALPPASTESTTESGPFRMPDEPVAEGEGRNTLLYRLARSLKARNLTPEAIRAAVEVENSKRCRPALPADELRTLLEHALRQPDRPEFRGASPLEDEEAAGPEPVPVPEPAPYQFDPAFPPDHFVSQVIAHISAQTDAPCEYAEAGALTLLTAVTPRIKARLSPYPKGLGTNLYVLGIGRSTVSRKSTSKNHAKALHEDSAAAPSILPDKMSPEALEEQMAKRDGDAATWYVDEFGEMLRKLHHSQYMVDFQGDRLQLYDGLPLVKERHSKRNKQTGEQEQDRDRAQRPNLSVFGMTTPLLFHKLHLDDIESGLLARFAIVYPLTKPIRRGLFESGEADVERARALSAWLDRIHAWNRAGAIVTFTPEAMAAVDAFDAEQEQRQAARADDDVAALMYERHTPMLVKVAMLAAVGRPGRLPSMKLVVTLADVECALAVLRRWEGFTTTFVKSLSATEQERLIQRCADMVRKRGAVPRKVVARDIHIPKRQLDDMEATLIDRGTITAKKEDGIKVWRWTGGNG